jgi:hypothetical protein
MYVKYRQDNLHCMTWYTGMCSSNDHRLTIHVNFMVKCICYTGLWIHWFRDHSATIPNGLVNMTDVISWCGPLEVGLNHTTNVTYGMLCNSWGTGIVL